MNIQNELTLIDRLSSPTSPFFKPLLWGGVIVAALSAGLITCQQNLQAYGLDLPPLATHAIEILGYVSAAIATVSKLTVNFNPKQ